MHVRKGDRTLRVRFPDPPRQRRHRRHRARTCRRRTAVRRCSRTSSFDVGRGERLLVLGLNGAGKTSLLRILAGETTANLGTFSFGHNVNVGYYAQEHDNLQADALAARQHPRRGAHRRDPHRDPAARPARHDGPRRARRCSRRAARCRAARRPSWRWRC